MIQIWKNLEKYATSNNENLVFELMLMHERYKGNLGTFWYSNEKASLKAFLFELWHLNAIGNTKQEANEMYANLSLKMREFIDSENLVNGIIAIENALTKKNKVRISEINNILKKLFALTYFIKVK